MSEAAHCNHQWEYKSINKPGGGSLPTRSCVHCGRQQLSLYGGWIWSTGATATVCCPDDQPVEVDTQPAGEDYKQRRQRFEQDPGYHLIGAEFAANEASWAYEHGEPDQMWEAIDTARKHLMQATLCARRLEDTVEEDGEADE